jgi:hypothetical protein
VIELKDLSSDQRTLDRALIRGANEHIANVAWATDLEVIDMLCECSDSFCIQEVTITRTRFEEMVEEGEPVLAHGHWVEGPSNELKSS